MKLGIGTYSFGGIESFLGLGPTLLDKFKTISAMGFNCVEILENDLKNDLDDIKKWAEETGLKIISIHAQLSEDVMKKMSYLGAEAVITPGMPFNNKEEAIELAKFLDEMAVLGEKYNLKIGYHNHSKEFYVDQGKPILEYVIENSSKCYFQLDCGWAMNGGAYPPSFIRRYHDRFLSIHVKENCKVQGPGPQPASAHAKVERRGPFGDKDPMQLPIEERKKLLEQFQARMKENAGKQTFEVQCKMGDPYSNMNWQDIKDALDEQSFEAFWIIEREGFYDEHDKCILEDLEYLKANVK